MGRSSKSSRGLSRKPEEDEVESVIVGSLILSIPFLLPVLFFLPSRLLVLIDEYGIFVFVFGLVFAWFLIHAIISVIMALRSRLSSDQLRMLAKAVLAFDFGFPFAMAAMMGFWDHVIYLLAPAIVRDRHFVDLVVFLPSFLCVCGVLYVVKRFLGGRISEWYHLKPLSGVGSLKQVNKYLKDAERRLGKEQFEGASENFHSAAQMYASVMDWRRAGDYYWLAAETLAKESLDLRFGVAELYVFSVAAYLLCDDCVKADEAVGRVKGILKDSKVDDRGLIAFMLEVLEAVRTGDAELLQEDRQRLLRSVKDRFEVCGEEAAMLVEKNLDRLQQGSSQR